MTDAGQALLKNVLAATLRIAAQSQRQTFALTSVLLSKGLVTKAEVASALAQAGETSRSLTDLLSQLDQSN